ncbi:MAG: nucleotidyltransferase domain-containing protein [Patescibacteria group bacterium]|jgi:predicted nucleotidyltransferase
MAQKKLPKRILNEIKEYVKILKSEKLPIDKVILYGSFAKGKQHEWSDVDLCVVSPEFANAFKAMEYLLSKTPTVSRHPIEPIGFRSADLKDNSSSLIREINLYGIEVAV